MRSRRRRLVFSRLQSMLSLLAALKEIAHSQVKLRRVVDIVGTKVIWLEHRQELYITQKHRIRSQIRRNLLGFVLLNRGAGGEQIMVVLQRHLNSVVERDRQRRWALGERLGLWRRRCRRQLPWRRRRL